MEQGLRSVLARALREIGDAAAGAGAVRGVAHLELDGDHMFYLLAAPDRTSSLIGHGGVNAGCMRVLLRVRAQHEGFHRPGRINARVMRNADDVPASATWLEVSR